MVNCRDSPSDSPDSWYNSRMTEILLVDDERSIRDSLSCQLREAGFTVRVAATGAAGVAAFGERRPDLVLLDVMMPGMDGYAVCEAMRCADRETPIVFLSALDAEEDQIRGLDAGADDYGGQVFEDGRSRCDDKDRGGHLPTP